MSRRPGSSIVSETRRSPLKLYLAGPLSTTPEQDWNTALAALLTAAGHEVFLPQASQIPEPTAEDIFRRDMEGLDWSEAVVAVMDGSTPIRARPWECGYAYARGTQPIADLPQRLPEGRPRETQQDPHFNVMLWVLRRRSHVELPLCSVVG